MKKLRKYKNYFYLIKESSLADAQHETHTLRKRKELIGSGVEWKKLKINNQKVLRLVDGIWVVTNIESSQWLDSAKKILVLVYNVQSLQCVFMLDNKKRMNFYNAITTLSYYNILCLTETWLLAKIPQNALFLNQFLVHRFNRDSNICMLKHGGVLVAVTPATKHTRLSLTAHFVALIVLVLNLPDYKAFLCHLYRAH